MTREWVPLRTLSFIMAVKEEKTVSVLEWYVGKTSICLIFTTSNTATFEKKRQRVLLFSHGILASCILGGLTRRLSLVLLKFSSRHRHGMLCFGEVSRCCNAFDAMQFSGREDKPLFHQDCSLRKATFTSLFLLHPVCLCFALQGERPRMSIAPSLVFDKFRLVSSWQKSEDLLTEIIIQSNRGDHAGVKLIYWFLPFRFLSCFYLFFYIVFVDCKRVKQQ